jgi:hypothetical protein
MMIHPRASEIVMPVTGELVLDFAAYRRIALAAGRRGRWVLRICGVVIVLCEGALTLSSGDLSTILLATVGLIIIFLPELLVLLGWQQMRRLSAQPWRYEVTDTSVGIHTSQTSVKVGWDGISRARIRRHAWLYTVASTRRSLVVPRAAFSLEAQEEIDRFVREHRFPMPVTAGPPFTG